MTLYLAYGRNLDVAVMAVRAPTARLLGRAVLSGHRFVINTRGYATVVLSPRSAVHGVVWECGVADLHALDEDEGVHRGFYQRVVTTVGRDGAASATAEVYVATHSAVGSPMPGYLEQIIAAAIRHGLPGDYVAELEQWLTSA